MVINNRFGRDYQFTPLMDESQGGVTITGNVWDDTGELMDINQ